MGSPEIAGSSQQFFPQYVALPDTFSLLNFEQIWSPLTIRLAADPFLLFVSSVFRVISASKFQSFARDRLCVQTQSETVEWLRR